MRYTPTATAALAALVFLVPSAGAQAGLTPEFVCGLVTKAQVEKELGRKLYSDAEGMRIGGGAVCDFDGGEAQVMLFSGPASEQSWEAMLKSFGYEKTPRTPVPGLGAPAYVIYPPPKNQYQDVVAMVVLRTGPHTLVVSSAVVKGQPAQTALAPTVALVKLVLPKLK